jgi:hypothetical protein
MDMAVSHNASGLLEDLFVAFFFALICQMLCGHFFS